MSACTQNILLQIVEEDLAGVWLGLHPLKDRVNSIKKYFHIPDNIMPFSVIALGYSDKSSEFIDRYNEGFSV